MQNLLSDYLEPLKILNPVRRTLISLLKEDFDWRGVDEKDRLPSA